MDASGGDFGERFRASEQRLRDILDSTPAVVYVKDPEGRYLLINRRYEELHHISRAEAVGKTDHEIFPKEVADEFRANDELVLGSGRPLELEESVPQEDGLHTFNSLRFPLRDADGLTYAVCGISTDNTARKQAEEALLDVREAERKRMARDLHDGALQDLVYGLMEMEGARLHLEGKDADVAVSLGRAADAVRHAVKALRAAVRAEPAVLI